MLEKCIIITAICGNFVGLLGMRRCIASYLLLHMPKNSNFKPN
jgi:hypothetical protein